MVFGRKRPPEDDCILGLFLIYADFQKIVKKVADAAVCVEFNQRLLKIFPGVLQAAVTVIGIHCNYICPGGVDTPMISRIEQNTFGDTKTRKEAEQIFGAQYLDKRYCRPEEVANLALYLASDVSSHIMGSGIRLDGGMDALC